MVLESKSEWFFYSSWSCSDNLPTSTMYLAQQLLMNIQCSARSRSFAKETRALKMRSAVVANGSWQQPVERIIEADPVTTTQKLPKNLMSTILVIHHLKQIGKVKKFNEWMPRELTKNKKKSFWSVFSYCTQEQWTISGSDCDVWRKVYFIWQPAMARSVAGPRSSSTALPKAKLAPKNRSWSLMVHCQSDPL